MNWYAIDDEHPDEGESANATPSIDVHAEYCRPGEYEWRVEIRNGDDPFGIDRGFAETLAFAKSCAESRLRHWIARQAAALGITRIDRFDTPHTYLEIQYKNPSALGASTEEE